MSSGGPVLSEDAIAALVDAARDGRLPEEKPAPQRRRRMRAVDFTRPTKFTSEQERKIGRTLEAFSRTASTRLSAELRVPLELEVLTSTQLTWANAHAQVPANSTAAIFEVEPIGTRMLLSTESTLLLAAIELLLGGSVDGGVKERRMTDIDQALGRHFFERLLAQLTLIWTDVAGLSLKLETVDQHMETAQMVSVSEPTLSLMMEARLAGLSATLALLIPWTAIAPVADQFAAREDGKGSRSDDEATSVRRAVGNVEMTVRAEVAVGHDADRGRAVPEGGRPAAAERTRRRRHHVLRRQGSRPHRPSGPQRQPPRRAGHGPSRRWVVSASEALTRLGQSTAEACAGVLEMFAAGKISIGEITTTEDSKSAFAGDSGPVGRDVGVLRRRRHRRQRVPAHAGGRAAAGRLDDGHGPAGGSGRRRSCPSSSCPRSLRP